MKTPKHRVYRDDQAKSCFFRSIPTSPDRKVLIKITDRCDLGCAHCFVDAQKEGDVMSLAAIEETLIPRLLECRVRSATLTGGEPTLHPEFMKILFALRRATLEVTVCTNGTTIADADLDRLYEIGGVSFNVSLDGFRPESHGRFRGNMASFGATVDTIRRLGQRHLLKGLLVTPNRLATFEEYVQLCSFAAETGAEYVLMNPLSRFGRGVRSIGRLRSSEKMMRQIRAAVTPSSTRGLELVDIRFPNDQKLPLAACQAGNLLYVFTNGDVTVCPYLVFATEVPNSQHRRDEFIVGNMLTDACIATKLDAYRFSDRYSIGTNATCQGCDLAGRCGKGCPAAVIADGGKIGDLDVEQCPKA